MPVAAPVLNLGNAPLTFTYIDTFSIQVSHNEVEGREHTCVRADAVGMTTVEVITSVPIVVRIALVTVMLPGRWTSDPLNRCPCPCSKTCR